MPAVALGPFSSSICHSQQSQELWSLGTWTGCCNFSRGFRLNLGETLRNQQGKSHQSDAIQGSKDLLGMHIHESLEGILKKSMSQMVPSRVWAPRKKTRGKHVRKKKKSREDSTRRCIIKGSSMWFGLYKDQKCKRILRPGESKEVPTVIVDVGCLLCTKQHMY